jgi:hypothetical protein
MAVAVTVAAAAALAAAAGATAAGAAGAVALASAAVPPPAAAVALFYNSFLLHNNVILEWLFNLPPGPNNKDVFTDHHQSPGMMIQCVECDHCKMF